jgi:hypothetical protein
LTKAGRNIIRDQYLKNPELAQSYQSSHLSCLIKETEKTTEETNATNTTIIKKKAGGGLGSTANTNRDSTFGQKLNIYTLFNSYNVALEKY